MFRAWSVIFLLFFIIVIIVVVVIHLFNHHFYLIAIIIIFFLVVIVFLLAITFFFTLRWRCRLRGRLSGFSERLAGSGPFGVAASGLHGRPSFVGVIVIVFCFIDG